MRRRALALCLILGAAALAGCAKKTNTTWETDRCQIEPPDLQLEGGEAPVWTGCRAMYAPSVAGIPTMFFIQFTTSGTTGSFASPGPGWLTITVSDIDSAAGQGIDVVSSVAGVSGIAAQMYYEGTSGGGAMLTGLLGLGETLVDAYGDPSTDRFTFAASASAATADGSAQVAGHFSVYSPYAPEPTGTGGSTGNTGNTCNSNACNGYSQQCNGYTQAPCYCAAACLCHCSGDTACEQQNRSYASSLGTSCSY